MNVQRGIARILLVISALAVAIGLGASAFSWRHARDRWETATSQPQGDPVILISSGFGYVRYPEGTSPSDIRAAIDKLKGIPGEDRLLDCSVDWVEVGTEEEKTGCKSLPLANSDVAVGYIYNWGERKAAPSVLFSRRAVAELEESNQLPIAVRRAVTLARAAGRWPLATKKPAVRAALVPLGAWAGFAASPWLIYFCAVWVIRGFRAE